MTISTFTTESVASQPVLIPKRFNIDVTYELFSVGSCFIYIITLGGIHGIL